MIITASSLGCSAFDSLHFYQVRMMVMHTLLLVLFAILFAFMMDVFCVV